MNTYSFQDVNITLSHSLAGQYIANGEGVGSIGFNMTTDRTAHDVGADGKVMVSKIKAKNGTAILAIQQTSPLNKWLLKLFNTLSSDSTSPQAWAGIKIVMRAPNMGDLITATGVSFQKQADRGYKAQGEQVTWNLMCAEIQQDVI
jgi:hypothetical protein